MAIPTGMKFCEFCQTEVEDCLHFKMRRHLREEAEAREALIKRFCDLDWRIRDLHLSRGTHIYEVMDECSAVRKELDARFPGWRSSLRQGNVKYDNL
jgi:hypothetical protein